MCSVDALSKAPMVVNSLVDSLLLIGQTSTNHPRLHFYRFYYTWEFHTRNAAVPTYVATKLRSEKWKAHIRVVLFEGDHTERARKNLLNNYTSSWDCGWRSLLSFTISKTSRKQLGSGVTFFFFICSFVSSVLIDQCDGYIVGTCAETVAKRNVQQEENIVMVVARGTVECGGDTRVVIVFARWARAAWLCSVAPSRRGQSRREVVSSSFFVCNGCGIFLFFLFFSSVLLVSHVVVVHQRSFYSGVEDDRHKVLLVVLVQPGYYYTTGAKQVHLPAAAASDTCLCFNYKCLCD